MNSEAFCDSLLGRTSCAPSRRQAFVPDPLHHYASRRNGQDILACRPDTWYASIEWSHTADPLSLCTARLLCYSPYVPVRARKMDSSTDAVDPAGEGRDG